MWDAIPGFGDLPISSAPAYRGGSEPANRLADARSHASRTPPAAAMYPKKVLCLARMLTTIVARMSAERCGLKGFTHPASHRLRGWR